MAEIGGESIKTLQALEGELTRLQGQVTTLSGMLERAKAQGAAAEAGAPRTGGAAAAGETAATGAVAGETAGRTKLAGMLDEEAARRQQLAGVLERGAVAENGLTAALEREIQVSAAATNELQARGALTTEFIGAAARGQVTLGELGTQAGLVAAKFGGWAAAAAGVYGLFDAIKKVGQGAIETQSGVGQLSRFFNVNPQTAGQGFRDVSQQLNVPVGEVATAQAQFARLYHDQTGSLTAARTALEATKLDNLSTADSYRYLTAAAQGFQLQASQLPGLLGMVNAEQRDLGARVSDTLPSIAKAAGAWKNAGGSLADLVSIVATGQRATGQGAAVGTALQRYVGRQLQMPSALHTISSFGINTAEDPGTILLQAVQRAQTLSPTQRQQLANALGGTKYGPRIFTPLLNQQSLLQQAGRSARAPGNVQDLSTEIAKVTGTSKEQITAIGNAFERVGSTLASSGLLGFGSTLARGLKDALDAANGLLEIFTGLPKPLQQASGDLLVLYGLMRTARRFNVGGPVGTLLGTTGDRRIGTQVGLGQQNIRETLADEQARVTSQVYTARLRAQAARSREFGFAQQLDEQGGTPTAAQSAQLQTLTRRAAQQQERLNMLLAEQAEIQVAINDASAQELAYKQASGTNLERAQAAGYAYVPSTIERGTGEAPMPVTAFQQSDEEVARRVRAGQMSLFPTAVAGGEADQAVAARTRAGQLSMFGAQVGAGADTASVSEAPGALKEAAIGLKDAALGLPSRIGGALRSIGSTFFGGPQGLLTGALVGYQGGEFLKSIFQGYGGYADRLGGGQASINQMPAGADALRNVLNTIGPLLNPLTLLGGVGGGVGALLGLPSAGNLGNWALGYNPDLIRARTSHTDEIARQTQAMQLLGIAGPGRRAPATTATSPLGLGGITGSLLDAQANGPGLTSGQTALSNLSAGQISQTIQTVQTDYQKGVLTYKQAQARLANALSDVAHSSIDPKTAGALRTAIQQAQAANQQTAATRAPDPQSLYSILNAMPSQGAQGAGGLSSWIKANQDLIQGAADEGQSLTSLGGQLAGAQTALRVATARVKGAINSGAAPSPQDVTALKDAETALKDLYGAITTQADDAAQLSHGNLPQIQAAYSRAIQQIQQSGGANTQQGQMAINSLKDKMYTATTDVLNARTTIANAMDVNPIADAERDINTIGQELPMAIATYGQNSKQVADLIKQRQQDYKQVADAQVALVSAQGDVAAAIAVTPTQTASAKLQTAVGIYNTAKASGQYNNAELTKYWADVLSAKKDLAQQELSTANDVTKANADLAASQTTDPVRQAYITWQADLKLRPDPAKPGDAQTLAAQANKAHQDYMDKWFTQQMDNVDFMTKTLQESDSQAASQYLKLSQNMKLSAQERRQAYEKYFELVQGNSTPTESELDLGKITMPTAYEVRSRMKEALGGTQRGIVMQNQPNVTVYVNSAGAATAVYNALDEAMGTSVTGAVRAAGG